MKLLKHILLLIFSITLCKKISVVIDTDADIDDIFAISYILSNEKFFDVKMILTSYKRISQPELVVARLLKEYDKTYIPIGLGLIDSTNKKEKSNLKEKWIGEISNNYEGEIVENGFERVYELIKNSPTDYPIHILSIGPLTDIANLLKRDPSIADRIKVYIMAGIITPENSTENILGEENISMNTTAAQTVFDMKYKLQPIILTPLNTASLLRISDDNYRQFLHYANIGCKPAIALLNYYEFWFQDFGYYSQKFSNSPFNPSLATPKLYDVLAAISLKYFVSGYNLENEIHINYTEMKLYVDNYGRTIQALDEEYHPTFIVAKGFAHDVSNDIESLSKEVLKSILLPCVLQKAHA